MRADASRARRGGDQGVLRAAQPETSDQLRVEAEVEATRVAIVEWRAPWSPDFGPEWSSVGVARLRYTATKREWTLQSADSDGRWSRYEYINAVPRVDVLLNEIDRDPTGIFWG
jgi:hypothetical protein